MDCIFCKIAAGQIPCQKLYEDEQILAFRDIQPQAPAHLLIIPKAHIEGAKDLTPEHAPLVGHIFAAIAQLARQEGLDAGFRVVINSGQEGGQTVGHLHFHLLGGRQLGWPPG